MIIPRIGVAKKNTARLDELCFASRYWNELKQKMETTIMRLAVSGPADLTDDQWAYCIVWTWNLHCACGTHPSLLPTAELTRLVAELQAKIDAGPNLATIDWFWDEYIRLASGAHNYSHFRPTSPHNRSDFEAGAHGGHPISTWRCDYEERVAMHGA